MRRERAHSAASNVGEWDSMWHKYNVIATFMYRGSYVADTCSSLSSFASVAENGYI